MKIAFVGKGGSGKTTLSALFSRYSRTAASPWSRSTPTSTNTSAPRWAPHPPTQPIPPSAATSPTSRILRGPTRGSLRGQMVKTTPPGRGSRLLGLSADNPVHQRFGRDIGGVLLMLTGPFSEDDLGVSCYHSKVGAVEMYLNHLVDGPGEYVVVDMTAGADSFASGLFTRFDVTFLVAEPTVRGVGVYRQYVDYARDYDVTVHVIGNKVHGPDDVEFLRDHVGDALTVCLTHSGFVRAMEKGRFLDLAELEEDNLKALARMRDLVDAAEQDWEKFTRQTVEFHLRNAEKWANAATGVDLAAQVDRVPMGPEALAASRQWC